MGTPLNKLLFSLTFLVALGIAHPALGLDGDIVEFGGQLDSDDIAGLGANDQFGSGVAGIGDWNGDGIPDVAIGAQLDDDGGTDKGAVYLISLNADGTAASVISKISEANDPNSVLSLGGSDRFGRSIAHLGDYDGDGNQELAVGEFGADSPSNSGRVWVIDLDASGVPQSAFTVESGSTNFVALSAEDRFGIDVANLGDWNGDGAPELGVGAIYDGASQNGAIYVLYLSPPPSPGMNATGIETYSKVGDSDGNFDLVFEADNDWFGSSITSIGDLDDDGQIDLAVGARKRGATSADGSVILLFMDPACSDPLPATPPIPNTACGVRGPGTWVEIAEGQNGFNGGTAGNSNEIGSAVAWLEDTSGLAPDRLVIGEWLGDASSTDWGQLWVVTLDSTGQVTSERQIAEGDGFTPTGMDELFAPRIGFALASIGDLNDDGVTDLVTGAHLRDWNGLTDVGTAWVLALNPCSTLVGTPVVYHSVADDGVRVCPAPEP